jgi:hypothetical protein
MPPRLSPVLLFALVIATPAAAQPPAPAILNQSIDAGLQWALLLSGRDATPGMQVAWRRWFSPHLGVGADVRWGQKHTISEFNSPAQPGPAGVLIPAMEGHDEQRISSYGFGGGIVARTTIGRVSLVAGGGPGFFLDRSTHQTRINAAEHSGSTAVRSVGLFMLMEMEVRATRHLSSYAGIRAELRDLRFPDSSFGYPTVGVRLAF